MSQLILTMPRFFGVLGLLVCAVGLAIPLSEAVRHGVGAAWGRPLIGLLVFTGPGLYLTLGAYVHRVTLTPDGIAHRDLLGRTRFLAWSQLQGAHFNETSLQLAVWDGRQRVQCHAYLSGFDQMVERVAQQLGKTSTELGLR